MTTSILAMAGCSPGVAPSPTDPHGVVTTTTIPVSTTSMSPIESLSAYRSCLDDQGVVIDEIGLDARGRPRMALALGDLDLTDRMVLEALAECGAILSSGMLDLGADPELRAMVRSSLEELAGCVRDRGVKEFPDPIPHFDGVGPPFPVNRIPWGDPALPGAIADCSVAGGSS